MTDSEGRFHVKRRRIYVAAGSYDTVRVFAKANDVARDALVALVDADSLRSLRDVTVHVVGPVSMMQAYALKHAEEAHGITLVPVPEADSRVL